MIKDFSKEGSRHVRQTIVYDDEGKIISDTLTKGSSNGKGWCIMYNDKVTELVCKCPSASTIKVFMILAAGQQFEERGMVTTKKAVQDKLGITKKTCLEAFKWLKQNFIINEYTINGVTEYMVNPEYVTVGRDKKRRIREWIRRWQGQTVLTLPASAPPLGAISEPKPPKEKPLKKKRSVSCD